VSKAKNASVAELVDALDSKSCTFGCAGSIPARGTTKKNNPLVLNRLGDFSFIIIRQSIRFFIFIANILTYYPFTLSNTLQLLQFDSENLYKSIEIRE
jgi:hypothetical protein